MRPRRFDKQLRFVFMVLSGLMVVVGLASIGVNRLQIKSQERVLGESIAIIERSESVGRDADRAGALADRLAGARAAAEIADASAALTAAIGDMEAGIAEMRRFLTGRAGDLPETVAARRLVLDMAGVVGGLSGLEPAAGAERARLEAAGARLLTLGAAGADLARLRITAGIWQLYAAPAGQDARPMLDRLADRDFFAFERLGEMSGAASALARLVGQIAGAADLPGLAAAEADYAGALALARARAGFLPSARAAEAARAELAILGTATAPAGLADLRRDQLAARARLAELAAQLDARLALLADEAGRGRIATRARMQARVAQAGRRALDLSAVLAMAVVLAVGLGYLLWSRARRRVVVRLGAVADRIVEVARGETGRMMPISGHDEIGQLEKALNVLRRRTEQALRLRQSLESAVLARTADVVAEMRSANAARAEAEEQARARMHFLARMSHEIRTPLNGVIGLLDLVAGDEPDPARRARLETALTSARDLQQMTEDILTFSAGEEPRHDAGRAAFDLPGLVRGLADHLQVLAQARGLAPVVRIAADLPAALSGDAARIRQILVNLIANAVKYTAAGEVRLTVAHRPLPDGQHEIAFTVADTGPGMTAEEMRHAFDVYGRTADARRRGVPGVGLGLAIVRQLTDAMGGELRVSTAPGQGSSFALVLRLPVADPAALAAVPGAPPVPQAAGVQVLVVDDHPVNRLVARGYLERMGCSVTEAATGTEALAQAAAGRFDTILIDLDLPDMHGAEVARRIDRKGARLAAFTADLVRDDPATRARFGVDRVLTKPLSPRALAGVLPEGAAPADPAGGAAAEAVLREDMASLGATMTAQILSAFLDDLALAPPALAAAADPAERSHIAHRLKGAAANFALHDLCARLQRVQKGEDAAAAGIAAAAGRAGSDLRAAAGRLGLHLTPAGAKQ